MDKKTVEAYILSMANAVREYPFGEDVAVYKVFVPEKSSALHFDAAQESPEETEQTVQDVPSASTGGAAAVLREETEQVDGSAGKQVPAVHGDWKMFALMSEKHEPVQLSLKCDPQLAVVLREKYESVMPGYHLNKKHWNTLILSGQLSWEEVQDLIRHSYNLVTGSS